MLREQCIRCTVVGRLFVPLAVSNAAGTILFVIVIVLHPKAYTEGYTAAAATVRVIRRNLLPQRWGPTDPVGAAVARAIADCIRCGKAVQGVNPRGGLAAAVAISARMRLSEVKVVNLVIVEAEVVMLSVAADATALMHAKSFSATADCGRSGRFRCGDYNLQGV